MRIDEIQALYDEIVQLRDNLIPIMFMFEEKGFEGLREVNLIRDQREKLRHYANCLRLVAGDLTPEETVFSNPQLVQFMMAIKGNPQPIE